ncbi:hypothetical protein [Microcoleus sp. MON2_D5]|uniref:hypothetical protein n=1 Tax=Microcoleus sp. MON2_D5 TaxID=2818833 RepID=UPI002FD16CD3
METHSFQQPSFYRQQNRLPTRGGNSLNQKSDFSTYPKGQKMVIRHKLMLIWAPLALCLVPILYGCTITTTDGKTATIASPGVASTGFAPDKVPPTAELVKLTKESLLVWNEGVQTKDYTEFYSTISKTWQKQATQKELTEAFQAFIYNQKKGTDTNFEPVINTLEPVFTPAPAIDSDGVLILQGYYPSTPSRMNFTLKYIPEADAWKLLAISLRFVKVPTGEAEDAPTEDAPAEDAPAEEAPAEEAPAEEAPAKDTP